VVGCITVVYSMVDGWLLGIDCHSDHPWAMSRGHYLAWGEVDGMCLRDITHVSPLSCTAMNSPSHSLKLARKALVSDESL
jgi:hypothetical protein